MKLLEVFKTFPVGEDSVANNITYALKYFLENDLDDEIILNKKQVRVILDGYDNRNTK